MRDPRRQHLRLTYSVCAMIIDPTMHWMLSVNPFSLLVVLFIAVPIVEMYLLIKIGGVIGALPTIGLVVVTAMVGVALLRQQGLATLHRVQTALDRGELPATEMLEGIALLLGGALLLTPGFVTDGLGLFCLIPTTRRILVRAAFTRVLTPAENESTPNERDTPKSGRVIEGEFTRKRKE